MCMLGRIHLDELRQTEVLADDRYCNYHRPLTVAKRK